MPFAIQEHLLPGTTVLEQLQTAQKLGFVGVEFQVTDTMAERLPEIAAAIQATGVRAAAVNLGHTYLLHPDFNVRDQALVAVRRAMTFAIDLEAQGVVFKPFYSPNPVLPDLRPYKSALELEAELLVTQLRATLCDLAYALGTELLLQPVNHHETHLVRRVEHGATIRRRLDDHPHFKLAVSTCHMQIENEPLDETLRQFARDTGYLHLVESDQGLPGTGSTSSLDLNLLAKVLQETGYSGWLTVASDTPGNRTEAELTACFQALQSARLNR